MVDPEATQRLVAILAADAVGYTRLMRDDEAATMASLDQCRAVFRERIEANRGRVVDTAGDSVLAVFETAAGAVRAALAIQRDLADRNEALPPDRRMHFRIGAHLGDIMEKADGSVYGDGVNVAARLEGLAEPGSVAVSGTVYDSIEGKLDLGFAFLGEKEFKNVEKPVRAYRVDAHAGAAMAKPKATRAGKTGLVAAAAAVAVIALAGLAFWTGWLPPTGEPEQAKTAPTLPVKPSIAVLPFANLSDDPEQEYFTDGLTEDLITDLSKIRDLFVIARNSSFTYKGKSTKVQEVAADLGVQFVLEGSVRRAGDAVRINAQLIDALTGRHRWAERYEGAFARIFQLQDQVFRQIIANLAVELTDDELRLSGESETDVIEAYDTFLQGWDHYRRRTDEDSLEAIALFERAATLDPSYSRTYAGLAAAYWDRVNLNFDHIHGTSWERSFNQVLTYLDRALETPTPDAYRVSAEMLALRGRHEEALVEIDRAIAMEPNNPDGHVSKARVLNVMGRAEEAEKSARTAMRLDPHYRAEYLRVLGLALFHQERYREAAELLERAVSRQPGVVEDYTTLASAYGHLDLMAEARSAIAKANEIFDNMMGRPVTVQEYGMYWWYGDIFGYDSGYLERLREGMRKAGFPEGAGEPERHKEYRALMTRSNGLYSVAGTTKIDVAQAKALHDRGAVFVDVRGSLIFRRGHIPGAVDLDLTTVLSEQALSAHVGKGDEVVLYCFGKHCPWSAYSCAKAVTWGFNRVYHFEGGFPAWEAAGYPVETSAVAH